MTRECRNTEWSKEEVWELQFFPFPGGYSAHETRGDCTFCVDTALLAVNFGPRFFRHVKGEKAGTPLYPEPWQAAIDACLFGYKRPNGLRRYRESYQEVPRGNGKSTRCVVVAGVLLYIDDEPGADIFSAAGTRDQAREVFSPFKLNVLSNKDLSSISQCYQNSVVRLDTKTGLPVGVYKAISADADFQHGGSPHGVIFDELHVQANRELWDVLHTGKIKRRQPLTVAITTAGFDLHSICYERRKYAEKVRDGVINDPSFLPVIYAANPLPHVEKFQSIDAIRRLDTMCTCENLNANVAERCWREACASCATIAGVEKTGKTTASGAATTQTGQFDAGGCAPHATNKTSSTGTQNTRPSQSQSGQNGQRETNTASMPQTTDGECNQKTNWRCQNSGGTPNTGCGESSTKKCETAKAGSAQFATEPSSCASITAMIQELSGACSAPPATRALALSETLKNLYSAHSTTCAARLARLDGDWLLVDCPGDDWTSPETWEKANPNLGISIKLEDLAAECEKAKAIPGYENTFKRLHLDIWTEQDVRAIPMNAWDACGGGVDPVEWRREQLESLLHQPCVGGLDLGSTGDLTALVLLFGESKPFTLLPFFWVPQESAVKRERRDHVPYPQWIKQGFIFPTPLTMTDYDKVRLDINKLADDYGIRELAVDRLFQGAQLCMQLGRDGLPVQAFGQSFLMFAAPTKFFLELIMCDGIRHGNNPVLRWMAANAATDDDAHGNLKFDKKKSLERIDGIVASVMALGRVNFVEGPLDYYESHSLEMQ